MILLGTSGFSYTDWKGRFYPERLGARDMLAYYARRFPACEINATYYRIPAPAQTAAMLRKAGPSLVFVAKAHQSMTHHRDAGTSDYAAFADALRPWREAGRLGAVLLQYPYAFTNTLEHRGAVVDVRDRLADLDAPCVVEFRHHSWLRDETQAWLAEQALSMVNVDEPRLRGLMPPTETVTGPVGYVRFHGRNAAHWFRPREAWQRYDYRYTAEELSEWVPRLRRIDARARTTFVFFNNHWQSQAVDNARDMARLLGVPLPAVGDGGGQTDLDLA